MVNNQRGDVMPWPQFPPISPTQPYTSRDGATMLQILERLKVGFVRIQDQWREYQEEQKQWGDDVEKCWCAFRHQYETDFTNLRDELIALIKEAAQTDNIMVWSPAYGQMVPLQQALDETYDADRIHGLFVKDFDDLEITPAMFDALQVNPRVFDMHSTEKINTVQGDITGTDITWLQSKENDNAQSQQNA